MSRQTCLAVELTDDSYIFHYGQKEIRNIAKAHTVGDRTHVIYADGLRDEFEAAGLVALATEDEVAAYRRERDRFAVARALSRLGSQIIDQGLPVPVGGRGIVISFDLADDSDLEPWSRYLSKRPQRGTSRPHVQAEAEGVEVYVYGPGTSGEFGPDLADAALTESVEHRDSVGAFPVVAVPHKCENPAKCWGDPDCPVYSTRTDKPERDGWAPPSGHSVAADEDALRFSREGN